MPSYFYHLKFELYPKPAPQTTKKDTGKEGREIWLPEPTVDIFLTEAWPKHKPVELDVEESRRWRRDNQETTHSLGRIAGTVIDCGPARRLSTENERNLISVSLESAELPPPSPAHIPFEYSKAVRDWRYGAVRVESVDMVSTIDRLGSLPGESSVGAQNRMSSGQASPGIGGRGTKAKFEALGGKNTETGWGIVHLYRDGEETPGLGEVEVYNAKDSAAASTTTAHKGFGDVSTRKEEVDYTTLCIPAVPSYFNPNDFLGFVGEKTWEQVSHFRMVMTEQRSRYLVLMKFRDSGVARGWKKDWDGKIFNVMEVG
jgi:BRCA1-associated protein